MSWYQYEDGREQKAALQRKIEDRRNRGEQFEALVVPKGLKFAKTFWGHGWCRHLESFSDYSNRLPRGRSYLRQGNVYNLDIEPGRITAQVTGSSLYDVSITIQPLTTNAWSEFKSNCAGEVSSLLDLLSGKLGDGVLRAITDKEHGLFPTPREIRLNCSCPDYADLCKHAAAVLYGVGVQLDSKPDLFFVLRSVDPSELITSAAQATLADTAQSDAALAGEDLSALFGIEMSESPAVETPKSKPKRVSAPKKSKAEPLAAKSRKASG